MLSSNISTMQDDEDEEARRQKELDAEIQKNKARQAFLDNLYVLIAMVLVVVLAVICVVIKVVIFPDEKIITFIPLPQQVFVIHLYTEPLNRAFKDQIIGCRLDIQGHHFFKPSLS